MLRRLFESALATVIRMMNHGGGPALAEGHIKRLEHPQTVWRRCDKIALDQIRRLPRVMITHSSNHPFAPACAAQASRLH